MRRSNKVSSQKHPQLRSPSQKELKTSLSDDLVRALLVKCNVQWRQRIFSPLTTLWIFINQVLSDDKSCRSALLQYFLGQTVSQSFSGAYCRARQRLQTSFLSQLFEAHAQQLLAQVSPAWTYANRHVKLIDGTTLSMPDTADNQAHYPAHNPRGCPVAFPLMRMVVVICQASGVVLQAALGAYQGKGSGEVSLLRRLMDSFCPEDLVVFDRCYVNYWILASLSQRQMDFVSRQHRHQNCRRRRLGRGQYLLTLPRPRRPDWMSVEEYETLPAQLCLREVQLRVAQRGFRTRQLVVLTSLLQDQHTPEKLAQLYRQRWNVELDIRNIKSRMGLRVLRCQSADMVRKEVYVSLLAYNLVRATMMEAALIANQEPREISFAAALKLVTTLRDRQLGFANKTFDQLYQNLLDHLAAHTLVRRPDRVEPRALKRRPHKTHFDYLNRPRQDEIKSIMARKRSA